MDILNTLKETKAQTLEYFDLPKQELGKTYKEGKWDVRSLLIHLADAETILYERIRRTIAEPRPVLWGFDQDAWASNLNYSKFPLSISRDIYGACRNGIIYLTDTFYKSKGSNEFIHSETGVRTLKQECEKVADHNQHHLDQIKSALES